MSLAKLTLRPPPNIDFVQGYPGIPPGAPDRPQAAVKGAIEVRVSPQGVKAKWVRIELRKVETLPGGGLANTYYDFVGQSPINVWQSAEEYSTLSTQDFPFYIRIPESIPPSIALEKGAGIKYELIATVCIKGKKGLLRRDKPSVISTSSTIIIDKHELHSTWPVYQQPETRSHTEGAVTLTVDRSRTCYGPGDRVSIMATVKSSALHTGILRGYEFTLRETTVFRASPHSSKKGAPVIKVGHIGEQKVPLNVTLYGGMQHKAELAVTIPQHHTSATLNAARHIDITYTLVVRALMGTGQHVTLELPIIVSNWPRAVSQEAMRRIGMAPTVSLSGPAGAANPPPTAQSTVTHSHSVSSSQTHQTHPYANADADIVISRPALGQYNTAPTEKSNGYASVNKPDEFGVTRNKSIGNDSSVASSNERLSSYNAQTVGSPQGIGAASEGVPMRIAPFANETTSFARPRAQSARAQSARLTITNLNERELAEPEHKDAAERAKAQGQGQSSRGQSSRPSAAQNNGNRSKWLSAEEEKRRLYETAVANVERVQGVTRARTPDKSEPSTPPAAVHSTGVKTSPSKKHWPTAEQEKAALFHNAQAAVARKHGLNGSVTSTPAPSMHVRSDSVASQQPSVSSYNGNATAGGSGAMPQTPPSAKSHRLQYSSAEEEKAALKRYYEAKAAVDRTQSVGYSAPPASPPIPVTSAYDALYGTKTMTPLASAPAVSDSPPPFVSSPSQPSYLSEKDRLRLAYEAQDAAAASARPPNVSRISAVASPTANYVSSLPTPMSPPPPSIPSVPISSAVAEKEMLRRKFEAQDAAAFGPSSPPAPPPRMGTNPPSPPYTGSRPIPVPPRSPPIPPGAPNGSQPLTAAEEKARLKMMYEAEDRIAKPAEAIPPAFSTATSPPMNSFQGQDLAEIEPTVPAAPPPLMPRPPKEYIQETQEEDLRTHARLQAIDKEISSAASPLKTELILSSFSADLIDSNGNPIPTPGPPPPIHSPPNMPVETE